MRVEGFAKIDEGSNEKNAEEAPVISYPPEAILEIGHVAAWLRVSERTVERLDIPFALLGKRTKRFLGRDVLAFIEKKRMS
jgi:hypothetical protein